MRTERQRGAYREAERCERGNCNERLALRTITPPRQITRRLHLGDVADVARPEACSLPSQSAGLYTQSTEHTSNVQYLAHCIHTIHTVYTPYTPVYIHTYTIHTHTHTQRERETERERERERYAYIAQHQN